MGGASFIFRTTLLGTCFHPKPPTEFADGTNTRTLKLSTRADLKRFTDSLRENFITTGVPWTTGSSG